MVEKIIYDTDPGVDDTMAFFYAYESGLVEFVGVTTIFGNVHTDLATTNALRLLEMVGLDHVPVAKGADNAIARPFGGPVPHIHGSDGQGDVNLPPPKGKAIDQTAAQFIVEQVMSNPGEITLVPVGPLTNIALALRLEPRIAQNVKRVVLMGGAALVNGNVNPATEANIHNDPEAADVVFTAGWDITMVGLDVTHKVILSHEELAQFGTSKKVTWQHVHKILPLYIKFIEWSRGSETGIFMHDPTAFSYMFHPEFFTVKQYPVYVETAGHSRGKTWVWTRGFDHELDPPWTNRPLVNICVDADVPAINRALLATV